MSSFVNLMSEFQVSFDSGFVDYLDKEEKKVSNKKEFDSKNQSLIKNNDFGKFLDYMDRKAALENKSKLSKVDEQSLLQINETLQSDYFNQFEDTKMIEPDKNDPSKLKTGMFDFDSNDLSEEEKNNYKELFEEASKNQSVMFKDVISFETEGLIQAGIYNPISGELNRQPLIDASRKMLKDLYRSEKLNESTISVGEIHYNTNHFHIHFATSEVKPTRPMVLNEETGLLERKGKRSEKNLDSMKQTFANHIFNRSAELERISNLRNSLRADIIEDLIKTKKTHETIPSIEKLKQTLPESKKNWNMKNASPETKIYMKELVNQLMKDNPNFKEFKQIVKEESDFKALTYGNNSKKKGSYYENRIHGEGDGIYYRLGNAVFSELRNEEKTKEEAVEKLNNFLVNREQNNNQLNHLKKNSADKQSGNHKDKKLKDSFKGPVEKKIIPGASLNREKQYQEGNNCNRYKGKIEGKSVYRSKSKQSHGSLVKQINRLEKVTNDEYEKYKAELTYQQTQQAVAQAQQEIEYGFD